MIRTIGLIVDMAQFIMTNWPFSMGMNDYCDVRQEELMHTTMVFLLDECLLRGMLEKNVNRSPMHRTLHRFFQENLGAIRNPALLNAKNAMSFGTNYFFLSLSLTSWGLFLSVQHTFSSIRTTKAFHIKYLFNVLLCIVECAWINLSNRLPKIAMFWALAISSMYPIVISILWRLNIIEVL